MSDQSSSAQIRRAASPMKRIQEQHRRVGMVKCQMGHGRTKTVEVFKKGQPRPLK